MFVDCLFKDVLNREEYVFWIKFLKYLVVLKCFIEEMMRLMYLELCFIFLLVLNEINEKKIYEYKCEGDECYLIEIFRLLCDGINVIYYDRKKVKLISFVIYYGYY